MVDAFTAGLTHYNELADEVVQLRQALTSRAVIEQAKGVLMSRRRCSADRAFELLRKMSNDSNVRLADVAAALVYQVVGSARTTV
jgi:AmiR/NasT family two-component response regulator